MYEIGYKAPKEKHGRFAEDKNVQETFKKRCKLLFDLLGAVTNKKVLDLGAGACDYSIEFAKMGADVTAIDLSKDRMEFGLKQFPDVTVKCHESSMENLPVKDKFDIILIFNSFRYVENKEKVISEIKRVSRKGTKIILIEQNPTGAGRLKASKEEQQKWFKPVIFDKNFSKIYSTTYFNYHNKVPKKIIEVLNKFRLFGLFGNEYLCIYKVKE